MADTLKDIPEFFETEIGESISARTDALGTFNSKHIDLVDHLLVYLRVFFFLHLVGTFRELGPPDLCHIIKANSKPGLKEVLFYI